MVGRDAQDGIFFTATETAPKVAAHRRAPKNVQMEKPYELELLLAGRMEWYETKRNETMTAQSRENEMGRCEVGLSSFHDRNDSIFGWTRPV